MMKLDVTVKRLRESAVLPQYATEGSAAADLRADLSESIVILPGARAAIPTGLAIAPERSDVVALIFSRSGMGVKQGVTLANSVGVIDSDYRGEIKVVLVNHGSEAVTISHGDRIAQMMFVPIAIAAFTEREMLSETERGSGGFGSTGTR